MSKMNNTGIGSDGNANLLTDVLVKHTSEKDNDFRTGNFPVRDSQNPIDNDKEDCKLESEISNHQIGHGGSSKSSLKNCKKRSSSDISDVVIPNFTHCRDDFSFIQTTDDNGLPVPKDGDRKESTVILETRRADTGISKWKICSCFLLLIFVSTPVLTVLILNNKILQNALENGFSVSNESLSSAIPKQIYSSTRKLDHVTLSKSHQVYSNSSLPGSDVQGKTTTMAVNQTINDKQWVASSIIDVSAVSSHLPIDKQRNISTSDIVSMTKSKQYVETNSSTIWDVLSTFSTPEIQSSSSHNLQQSYSNRTYHPPISVYTSASPDISLSSITSLLIQNMSSTVGTTIRAYSPSTTIQLTPRSSSAIQSSSFEQSSTVSYASHPVSSSSLVKSLSSIIHSSSIKSSLLTYGFPAQNSTLDLVVSSSYDTQPSSQNMHQQSITSSNATYSSVTMSLKLYQIIQSNMETISTAPDSLSVLSITPSSEVVTSSISQQPNIKDCSSIAGLYWDEVSGKLAIWYDIKGYMRLILNDIPATNGTFTRHCSGTFEISGGGGDKFEFHFNPFTCNFVIVDDREDNSTFTKKICKTGASILNKCPDLNGRYSTISRNNITNVTLESLIIYASGNNVSYISHMETANIGHGFINSHGGCLAVFHTRDSHTVLMEYDNATNTLFIFQDNVNAIERTMKTFNSTGGFDDSQISDKDCPLLFGLYTNTEDERDNSRTEYLITGDAKTIYVYGTNGWSIQGSLTEDCKGKMFSNFETLAYKVEYFHQACAFYIKYVKTDVQVIKKSNCGVADPTIFLSGPKLTEINNTLYISGCNYYYYRDLSIKVKPLLLNGRRVEQDMQSVLPELEPPPANLDGLLQMFEFPKFIVDSYAQRGTYQCVIDTYESQLWPNPFISGKSLLDQFPEPEFTSGPTIVSSSENVKGLKKINGCKIKTIIPKPEASFHYIKNGYHRIDTFITGRINRTFPALNFTKPLYTDQGFYQCMVRIEGLQDIISSVVDVQFKDVSATKVEVKFQNRTFVENYKDRSSGEFKNIERELTEMLFAEIGPTTTSENVSSVEIINIRPGSIIVELNVLEANQTSEQKMQHCDSLYLSKLQNDLQRNDIIVTTNSLDCCKKTEEGDLDFRGEYIYNATLIKETVNQTCVYLTSTQSERKCVGDLRNGPRWKKVGLMKCPALHKITNELIHLSKISDCATNDVCPTVLQVASNLTKILTNVHSIKIKQDVEFISNIIDYIISNIKNNSTHEDIIEITEGLINIVSQVLNIDHKIMTTSKESSLAILKNLDQLARKVGYIAKETNTTLSVSAQNVAFAVAYTLPNELSVVSSENSNNTLLKIEIGHGNTTNSSNEATSTFQTPKGAYDENKKAVVYAFTFRKNTLFQSPQATYLQAKKNDVASHILAVTVLNNQSLSDNKTVEIGFALQNKINIDRPDLCCYWDFPKERWMTDGCFKVSTNVQDNSVSCRCNHLTNFAILLDVSQTYYNPIALQYITRIGCAVSLCGLVLTIVSHVIFRNVIKKLPPKILVCLCTSMALLLLTFLLGVENTSSKTVCKMVAVSLHYFTLTTFFWSLVEAYNLYRNFIRIFNLGSSNKRFLYIALLFAWGLPGLIVVCTSLIFPENLGNEKFCIVTGSTLYIAVLPPVALTLLINFIMVFVIMRSLTKKSAATINRDKKNELWRQIRAAFTIATLLGLTWGFALFAIGDLKEIFQWLFTISNSLQGTLIFILYTLRNPVIRREWSLLLGRKRQTLPSSSTEMKSKETNVSRRKTNY